MIPNQVTSGVNHHHSPTWEASVHNCNAQASVHNGWDASVHNIMSIRPWLFSVFVLRKNIYPAIQYSKTKDG